MRLSIPLIVLLVLMTQFAIALDGVSMQDYSEDGVNLNLPEKDITITINESLLNVNDSRTLLGTNWSDHISGSWNQLCYFDGSESVKGLSGLTFNGANQISSIGYNIVPSLETESLGSTILSWLNVYAYNGIFQNNISVQNNISAQAYCTNGVCGNVTDFIGTGSGSPPYNITYHLTSEDVTANRSNWFSKYNVTYDTTSRDVTANRSLWFTTYNETYLSTYNASYLDGYNTNVMWRNQSNIIFGTGGITLTNATKLVFNNGSTAGSTPAYELFADVDRYYTPNTALYLIPRTTNGQRFYFGNGTQKWGQVNFEGVTSFESLPGLFSVTGYSSGWYGSNVLSGWVIDAGGLNSVLINSASWTLVPNHGTGGFNPMRLRSYVNDTTSPNWGGYAFQFDVATSINTTNLTKWTSKNTVNLMTLGATGNLDINGTLTSYKAQSWAGYAMCYAIGGVSGHCTDAVNSSGGCTCVAN